MGKLERNAFTLTGAALGIVCWALSKLTGIDLFDSFMGPLHSLHDLGHFYEAGEVFLIIALLLAGKAADLWCLYARTKRAIMIEAAKLRSIRATVRNIEDSVLNTYNGCQLLILEAREKGLPEQMLGPIEKSMEDSVKDIRALMSVTEAKEQAGPSGLEYIDTGK